MDNQHAIALLRRMQEPEAYEPQITAEAFEALGMAIRALEQASFPRSHENDLISRQFMYSLGATCLAKRNDDGELVAITGIRYLPSAQPEILACGEGELSTQPETAKRIVGKSRDGMTLWYQCDMCNEPVDAQDNFCRGCGRRLTDG